jgi:hypothetical protein
MTFGPVTGLRRVGLTRLCLVNDAASCVDLAALESKLAVVLASVGVPNDFCGVEQLRIVE